MWTCTSLSFRHHFKQIPCQREAYLKCTEQWILQDSSLPSFPSAFLAADPRLLLSTQQLCCRAHLQRGLLSNSPRRLRCEVHVGGFGRSSVLPFRSLSWEEVAAWPALEWVLVPQGRGIRGEQLLMPGTTRLSCAVTLCEVATWFSNSTDLGFHLGLMTHSAPPCYKTSRDINWGFAAQEDRTWLLAGNLSATTDSALSKDAE